MIANLVEKGKREGLKTRNHPACIEFVIILEIQKWSEATDERPSLRKEDP
jgi:hypothetical protein